MVNQTSFASCIRYLISIGLPNFCHASNFFGPTLENISLNLNYVAAVNDPTSATCISVADLFKHTSFGLCFQYYINSFLFLYDFTEERGKSVVQVLLDKGNISSVLCKES